jgi:uncharacterized protein (DUF2384 family)
MMAEISLEYAEKENEEWLRSTALSRALEYFEKLQPIDVVATPQGVIEVADEFFKFLKG